ncbi:MAG: CocE/NonD family hydrolase [Ginsengibacter sp.]
MKRILLTFFLSLPVLPGLAKEIHFPALNYSNSGQLEIKLPALAVNKMQRDTQPSAKQLLLNIEKEKFISDDSILVKMPDGGTVSLTVFRDRKMATPQPAILLYNIYAGNEAFDCKRAVARGYVGIVANTRGKRLSPDSIEPFENDGKDAYYIIDWISKQDWCNGKVGMYGGSYLGFAQWSATKHLHPALKTIVPQAAVGPGIDFPLLNGIVPTYLLRWLHFVIDNKLVDYAGFFNDRKWDSLAGKWYQKGLSFRSYDTLEGRPNMIYQRILQHPSYDSYWQNMIPQRDEFAKINIPILTTTGYYDDDQLGAMYYYKQYHQWNKNPNDYLIIGPFDHGGSQYKPSKILGGYRIDSVANISIIDIVFKWFDYVLKGGKLPEILKDKVNFELMGTNQWRHVATLKQMHNDSLNLYLGNQLNGKSYSLSKEKPLKSAFIDQQVDMTERNDPRFRQDDIIAFTKLIYDSLSPEKEKLVFVSEPVDGSFAISGALNASIDVSINKKDIDLVLDLYEQTADGHYFALNESLQRASYAKDRTTRHLLKPGHMETIRLEHNFMISKKLEKGSRLLVMIGVNKSPNYQVNYGTGKDVSDETMADGEVPLKIRWYNSSRITVPILRL